MIKRTQRHITVSFVFLGLTTAVFLVALYVAQSRGSDLQSGFEIIKNQQTIQKKQTVIKNVIDLSAAERLVLKEYFLSEREIISFISRVEAQAAAMNLTVETTQLAVEPMEGDKSSILKIGFSFIGTEPAAVRFMEYLELLPYYKEIPKAVLSTNNHSQSGGWEGNVILHLTLMP